MPHSLKIFVVDTGPLITLAVAKLDAQDEATRAAIQGLEKRRDIDLEC